MPKVTVGSDSSTVISYTPGDAGRLAQTLAAEILWLTKLMLPYVDLQPFPDLPMSQEANIPRPEVYIGQKARLLYGLVAADVAAGNYRTITLLHRQDREDIANALNLYQGFRTLCWNREKAWIEARNESSWVAEISFKKHDFSDLSERFLQP